MMLADNACLTVGSPGIPLAEPGCLPLPYPVSAAIVDNKCRVFVECGLALRGEFSGCDYLAIAGHVESDVALRVIDILARGSFKGSASVDEAHIAGRYEGVLTVAGTLVVGSAAYISGSVQCDKLQLAEGGKIEGELRILSKEAEKAAKRDDDAVRASLDAFPAEFSTHYRATMLRKLGLHGTHGGDDALLAELADLMSHVETDYTLLFRRLATTWPTFDAIRDAFYAEPDRARVTAWLERYAARDRDTDGMLAINPLYVPRNYLVQQVIEATERGDRDALPELVDVLRRPYTEQPGKERFAAKRPEWARVKPGSSMLSCSS